LFFDDKLQAYGLRASMSGRVADCEKMHAVWKV
jgi:hypothetical protein